MLSKFAEIYFENELAAGTPFTHKGANELTRLGVLTISIPVVTTVTSNITEGTIAGFMRIENAAAMDMYFDNETSIVIGVMFILGTLLCRYGAELHKSNGNSDISKLS